MTTSLCYPYGVPLIKGRLKSFAADFFVDEELGFEPAGEGEHLFLQIEKTELTTLELIDRVAAEYGIKARDIGYSGLKDKMAITRQWLSLHMPGQMNKIPRTSSSGYVVLNQGWHNRKLRPGTHRSNRFEVLLRNVSEIGKETHQQIEAIKLFGMANYFGQQRFGSGTDNVQRALQSFANARKARKLSRNKRSIYLSALRSELFNQILSQRIQADIWQEPIEGDVFMLAGSQSIFQEKLNDDILKRYRELDISSTASLYGQGDDNLCDSAKALERQVIEDNSEISQCLLDQDIKQQKRALRTVVRELFIDYQADEQQLIVKAVLPKGSYFTSLLNHFIDTD